MFFLQMIIAVTAFSDTWTCVSVCVCVSASVCGKNIKFGLSFLLSFNIYSDKK